MAGRTASGKTTIARLLEKRKGAQRIKYSDLLIDLARERGLDHTQKAVLQELYLTERAQRGESFLSKEMEHRVSALTAPLIVIEGNRRLVDIDTLRVIAQNRNDTLLMLYVDASVSVRFTRYNAREVALGKRATSMEDFMKLEENEAERELPQIMEICEKEGLVLDANTKTPEEIFDKISAALA
jgi:dephospho-CoA kinase